MIDNILKFKGLPYPLMQCENCGETIYKKDYWRQCPSCGAVKISDNGNIYIKKEACTDWIELCKKAMELIGDNK